MFVFRLPCGRPNDAEPPDHLRSNGVSLTTNSVSGAIFSINLIPHTLEATTLGSLQSVSRVNLEIDLIARYVERMLNPDTPDTAEAA